jgi:hypothetical protein
MRKEGLQNQGDQRMEQRKDSRISRLMQKKEQNKKNETEKDCPVVPCWAV